MTNIAKIKVERLSTFPNEKDIPILFLCESHLLKLLQRNQATEYKVCYERESEKVCIGCTLQD